jgi:hypothetical protein
MQAPRGSSVNPHALFTFLRLISFSGASLFAITLALPARAQVAQELAQAPPAFAAPTTILPTDVVPLPAAEQRVNLGENLQLRMLQRLPARFYFNISCETSFRDETNPFQYPNYRNYINRFLPPPPQFRQLPILQQINDLHQASKADINNVVFRVLPNASLGWTITPRTRFYGNFFMIRDSLMHSVSLNTNIFSVAYGIQQDIPISRKGNLQADFQVRSLYQLAQRPLYDFLPGLTYSYILTPRTVVFANALLQLRGKEYYDSPSREMDPFYTFGTLYQRGAWAYSANATLVTNYRKMFGGNALIPQDNYSWILDFEIARRMFKALPGVQSFVRAEPIYNFHSNDTPGLAGMDFRIFFGIRAAAGKPPLTAALQQIREQLEEQEAPPTSPTEPETQGKPSAYINQYIAHDYEPIHGFIKNNDAGIAKDIAGQMQTGKSIIIAASSSGDDFMPAYTPQLRHNFGDIIAYTPPVKTLAKVDKPKTHASTVKIATIHQAPAKTRIKPTLIAVADSQDNKPFVNAIANKTDSAKPKAAPVIARSLGSSTNTTVSVISWRKNHEKSKVAMATAKPKKELEMVVMQPLPTVSPNSKEPFAHSGINLSAPIMMMP